MYLKKKVNVQKFHRKMMIYLSSSQHTLEKNEDIDRKGWREIQVSDSLGIKLIISFILQHYFKASQDDFILRIAAK